MNVSSEPMDVVMSEASTTTTKKAPPPLVVHIIHRLAVGGLENGLVNLINATAPDRYRHAIVCLTDYSDFRERIRQADVPVIALHKRNGKDLGTHLRLWRVLQNLRPAIVHTRNLPAFEYQLVAACSGVRGRIHGEHGRDMYDLDGSNRKYNLLRKGLSPLISRFITVSQDLAQWLIRTVGIRREKVQHICNGVDVHRFHPRTGPRMPLGPEGFVSDGTLVVGAVGRMHAVKDQLTLVRAFLHLVQSHTEAKKYLRLAIIGDGPLREECLTLLRVAGAEHLAWLPGERGDIPELLRAFDLFVLPSIAEGISNTILEAMASGLPIVATRVGGNPELAEDGGTGTLVPAAHPEAMADALYSYLGDREKLSRHGQAGRRRAETCFSIEAMVSGYLSTYDAVLCGAPRNN